MSTVESMVGTDGHAVVLSEDVVDVAHFLRVGLSQSLDGLLSAFLGPVALERCHKFYAGVFLQRHDETLVSLDGR